MCQPATVKCLRLIFGILAVLAAGCGGGPSVPSDDYETTIIGTIRQGQLKQVEEEYDAGERIRGVIHAGVAVPLKEGRVDLDPDDLASAERGGVVDMVFRVEDDSGKTVLDLGLVPSGTEFEFVTETKGAYFFIFDNTATDTEELKAFSMGVNRVTNQK